MNKYLYRILVKINWVMISQLGIDPRKLVYALIRLPRYALDFVQFKQMYDGDLEIKPCLHDRDNEYGDYANEYFWQDLLVARMIYENNPKVHLDIGSRVDGFISHVAVFREVEVLDIRPAKITIPNVTFRQIDVMELPNDVINRADSVSCLHALEHFGLGRYGDRLDPKGYEYGLDSISRLVRDDGVLYLSIPVGSERVEFNANWIFDPLTIVNLMRLNGCTLERVIKINNDGGREVDWRCAEELAEIALSEYQLCVFVFRKTNVRGG